MKKTLTIIAAAVMLLTVIAWVLYAIYTSGSNQVLDTHFDYLILTYGLVMLAFLLILELALFGGIALLLSQNRTPLKVVLGIVIVMISLILLISLSKDFFRT